MAAKKSKTNDTNKNIISAIAIAVGIYLVVDGVLSSYSDTLRSIMIAGGLGVFASGVIGFCTKA